MVNLLKKIGFNKDLDYKNKLLYGMVLCTILVASFYLVIYLLYSSFTKAILLQSGYILFSISLFVFLKRQHYAFVKYAMIIAHMIQLSVAVFVWFPLDTGYNVYYIMVPMASFLLMKYDDIRERNFLTILSVLSILIYVFSVILPLNNYVYETSLTMNRFLSAMSILTIMFPMTYIFTIFAKELYLTNKELKKIANTDALTQITNRRMLYEQGIEEFNLAKKYKHDFSIILWDIDHFKRVNDQYGHPVGDRLLQKLATLVLDNTRKEDTLARYGGEEFAILLRKTDHDTAITIAEKLLNIIRNQSFLLDGHHIQVTASFGVTQYSKEFANFDDMMKNVDQALYKAKNNGRNQVISQ